MSPEPNERPAKDLLRPKHDYFDVYKLAVEDLHRTKELGQRIDSFYMTIITLLLTADAYEIATSKFNSWVQVAATASVAILGLAVTTRWRQGATNLYRITTNRYEWLRNAEQSQSHPEMANIGANIFTQEYEAVYVPQLTQRTNDGKIAPTDPPQVLVGGSKFRRRTVFLQTLCLLVFPSVPIVLAAVTYLTLNP